MDPHVDQELVASIEGFVSTHTAGPEAGKVFAFPLVHVNLFNVPHQLFCLLVSSAAVQPLASLFVSQGRAATLTPFPTTVRPGLDLGLLGVSGGHGTVVLEVHGQTLVGVVVFVWGG